jgi:hypothetical protein
MSIHNGEGLNRRRFIGAAGAGLGAVSVAGLAAACSGSNGGLAALEGPASDLANTVLEAFETHRLVGLGESPGLQNHHDVLQMLLNDPRLPGVIDDIVVEFGNALYQGAVDLFIAGQPVADSDLRLVWQNTTQSPVKTWDAPVYEQFYRTVRAVNWAQPADQQIRVLLGDPPIDWAEITNASELDAFLSRRDIHAASVVEKEVLAKGRRALLCYETPHLLHNPAKLHRPPQSLTAIIEQRTREHVYTISDLVPFAGDPGGLGTKLSRYPRDTVILTAGTWLGSVDPGQIVPVTETVKHGTPFNPYCGVPLKLLQNAGIYLGQAEDLTTSRPNPAIYLDPVYWKELQRRNALQGNPVKLDDYRKEMPPQYGLPNPPPSADCGSSQTQDQAPQNPAPQKTQAPRKTHRRRVSRS